MRRARARALLSAGALSASLVACSTLLDLGPEATLRDAGDDAGGGADVMMVEMPDVVSPPVDAAEESPYACGLPPAPNMVCNACSEMWCCDLGITCAKDARCAEGMAKLLACAFDVPCISAVQAQYGQYGTQKFQSCVLGQCTAQCLPGPNCAMLAHCCQSIDPTTMTAAREVCVGSANALDETKCLNILDNVLRAQLGANFCGGAPPSDGGADVAHPGEGGPGDGSSSNGDGASADGGTE